MNGFPQYIYEFIDQRESYPYDLLLLADETVEAINKYLFDSEVFLVKREKEVIGVFCLYERDGTTVELKNMAVSETMQGKGIGSAVLDHIKDLYREKYDRIMIGTADVGAKQIDFYERNGFVKVGIKKNFFLDNYDLPIFENGVQLRDMVLLEYCL